MSKFATALAIAILGMGTGTALAQNVRSMESVAQGRYAVPHGLVSGHQ